ncbi:MAG TPA: imidazoleglycerol-phosphate dehydratase HisB [Candidatus Aminicenantes bacterium]|nr:MAG: imidazoleglycerol-phosphate dehydratase HisB [Candidatus Aminicenantes bacterium]HEK85665.1 imidazoleglycerol-phosphate dehydratase HisB [Candidatus Aminicenantes bacterium]
MRQAEIHRITKETEIYARVIIEGKGRPNIKTPIGFFNHLLETMAFHARLDLDLSARGDLQVDQHHLVEDCGLVLGQVLREALGHGSGINRIGFFIVPMDDSLAITAVDLSGRPYLQFKLRTKRRFCGDLDTDLLEEFFQALARGLMANLVIKVPTGQNDHHKIEAVFKSLGRSLKYAMAKDPRESENISELLPSLKGVIDL